MGHSDSSDDIGRPAFVSWTPREAAARSLLLAGALRAETFFTYAARIGSLRMPALLRYAVQSWRTLGALRRQRPTYVLVQNPPVFAPLTAALYCWWRKCPLVIDHHTSFLDRRWRLFHWLQRPICRRARVNLAHNESNRAFLERWGLTNVVLLKSPAVTREEIFDPAADLGALQSHLAADGLKVFMVNRFAADDAYREVLAAARLMPDARFFLTGDPRRAGRRMPDLPDNVVLTGFLTRGLFLKLMDACDVVLALTLRDDTLLWSIRECFALGKPFVASDAPVIRREFGDYGLLTDHSPQDLAGKIRAANDRGVERTTRMPAYIARDKQRWREEIESLRTLLAQEAAA